MSTLQGIRILRLLIRGAMFQSTEAMEHAMRPNSRNGLIGRRGTFNFEHMLRISSQPTLATTDKIELQ